jgi:uncharacterized protein YjbI with pentapeptide repeats
MANEELLKRLKQGVKEWNQWRLQHPDLHPNLSGLNLSTVDLSMTRLSNVKLSSANLSGADLGGARIFGSNFGGQTFERSSLRSFVLVFLTAYHILTGLGK